MPEFVSNGKSGTVKAIQFTGDNAIEVAEFLGTGECSVVTRHRETRRNGEVKWISWVVMPFGGGEKTCSVGDYVFWDCGEVAILSRGLFESVFAPSQNSSDDGTDDAKVPR